MLRVCVCVYVGVCIRVCVYRGIVSNYTSVYTSVNTSFYTFVYTSVVFSSVPNSVIILSVSVSGVSLGLLFRSQVAKQLPPLCDYDEPTLPRIGAALPRLTGARVFLGVGDGYVNLSHPAYPYTPCIHTFTVVPTPYIHPLYMYM